MEGLQSKFKRTLSRFKISEFPGVLSFVFGRDLSWEKVRRNVDELRLNKRAGVLAEVSSMLYQKTRPSREDAMRKLWLLQLCDVSLHSGREWLGIQLTQPFPDPHPSLDEIEKQVVRSYKKELRSAIVMKVERKNLVFIMVIEEKATKKGKVPVRHTAPVFFVLNTELQVPYVFFTPHLTDPHPLELFSSAMGYQDYNFISYKGKDVSSLFEMVQRKTAGTVAVRPPMHIAPPVVDGYITDFTSFRWKSEYAESILTGVTNINSLTVKSTNEWRGTSVFPQLQNTSLLRCKMTIQVKKKTDSVADVLKALIAQGNIKVPVPSWVHSFANRPRNSITLHSQAANSSQRDFDETEVDDPNLPAPMESD